MTGPTLPCAALRPARTGRLAWISDARPGPAAIRTAHGRDHATGSPPRTYAPDRIAARTGTGRTAPRHARPDAAPPGTVRAVAR